MPSVFVVLLAALAVMPIAASGGSVDVAASHDREIREAAAASGDHAVRPLPLAGSWNAGTIPGGFDPPYQLEAIGRGALLLPWFNLQPPFRPSSPGRYSSIVDELAKRRLPLAFVGPEWEFELPDDLRYFIQPAVEGRPATARRGPPFPLLAPDSPLDGWYEAGRRWARHPVLERMQDQYPDPPRVLFVSNNEYPKPAWHDDSRWRSEAGRRALGDAWVDRYRLLLRGFREGLRTPGWRHAATFIGYDALAGGFVGRWGGWPEYSLAVPGRIEPWSLAWDGASVSYYLYDWNPISDSTVWSPQIEAMNLLPALAEARERDPAFWLELSVWDGQQRGLASDKAAAFAQSGAPWTTERYRGLLQFGLWLLRPRSVREFRSPQDDRRHFAPWFAVVTGSVERVHRDTVLREFWQHGRLLMNTRSLHPYQAGVPEEYEQRGRWALLESSANPPRPWVLGTRLEVYAITLVLGEAPQRRWLVYAHSPGQARVDSTIEVGEGISRVVRATRDGSFTLVEEGGRQWPIEP